MIYETFVCRQSHRTKDHTLINVAAEDNRHLNITFEKLFLKSALMPIIFFYYIFYFKIILQFLFLFSNGCISLYPFIWFDRSKRNESNHYSPYFTGEVRELQHCAFLWRLCVRPCKHTYTLHTCALKSSYLSPETCSNDIGGSSSSKTMLTGLYPTVCLLFHSLTDTLLQHRLIGHKSVFILTPSNALY